MNQAVETESALRPLIADNLYPGGLGGHSMRKETIKRLRPLKARVGWGKARGIHGRVYG